MHFQSQKLGAMLDWVQTVYKGRKKKSIEYYAIKSVEKSQKTKVLQEVKEKHSEVHCYPSGNGEGALWTSTSQNSGAVK
jgi:hypothetical protein